MKLLLQPNHPLANRKHSRGGNTDPLIANYRMIWKRPCSTSAEIVENPRHRFVLAGGDALIYMYSTGGRKVTKLLTAVWLKMKQRSNIRRKMWLCTPDIAQPHLLLRWQRSHLPAGSVSPIHSHHANGSRVLGSRKLRCAQSLEHQMVVCICRRRWGGETSGVFLLMEVCQNIRNPVFSKLWEIGFTASVGMTCMRIFKGANLWLPNWSMFKTKKQLGTNYW